MDCCCENATSSNSCPQRSWFSRSCTVAEYVASVWTARQQHEAALCLIQSWGFRQRMPSRHRMDNIMTMSGWNYLVRAFHAQAGPEIIDHEEAHCHVSAVDCVSHGLSLIQDMQLHTLSLDTQMVKRRRPATFSSDQVSSMGTVRSTLCW